MKTRCFKEVFRKSEVPGELLNSASFKFWGREKCPIYYLDINLIKYIFASPR